MVRVRAGVGVRITDTVRLALRFALGAGVGLRAWLRLGSNFGSASDALGLSFKAWALPEAAYSGLEGAMSILDFHISRYVMPRSLPPWLVYVCVLARACMYAGVCVHVYACVCVCMHVRA